VSHTGCCKDGKDGKDGQNGRHGRDGVNGDVNNFLQSEIYIFSSAVDAVHFHLNVK